MNEFIKRRLTRLASKVLELEAGGADGKALKVREELCELTRQYPQEGRPYLVHRLLGLAKSYRQRGAAKQAEITYLEVIHQLEQHPCEGQPDLPQVLNTVGVYYCELEQHQQAVDLFRRALDLSRDLQPTPKLATLHNNLASSYHSLRQVDEAREHYHEALSIFDQFSISLEKAHCLCDLAELLAEEEDEGATERINEAHQIFRHLFPAGGPHLAEAHLRIADLYCRMADTANAVTILEETAKMLEHSGRHQQELAQCTELLNRLPR